MSCELGQAETLNIDQRIAEMAHPYFDQRRAILHT
jgi:hypothetical protein